ncbi:hypothetical protein H4S01_005580, partial [Coemansia sp. RSA 2610]
MSDNYNQSAGNGIADGAQKVQASEQDMASLATAVEAMCGDFSQRSQRQRTLSWVSSA